MKQEIKDRIEQIQKGSVPSGYKQTPVGICPIDWNVTNLLRLAKIYDGVHQTPNYTNSGVKFVSVEDIKNIYDTNKYISYEDFKKNFYLFPLKDDILMTRIGDIGTPAIVKNDQILAYYVSLALFKPIKINTNYLFYLIKSNQIQKELFKKTIHVAFPKKINKNDIGKCKAMLNEDAIAQNQIAKILDIWGKAISLQEKKIEKLQEKKKALIQKLFKPKDDWNIVFFKDLFKERKTYCEQNNGYEHLTLSIGGVVPKTERYNRDFLVKEKEKKYKITLLNDICYNPANLKFGVICMNCYGKGIFSPIYVTYEICDNFDKNFVKYFVMRKQFIKQLRKYEQGTVYERMAVCSEDFLKYKTKFPNLKIQNKISRLLLIIDESVTIEKQLLEKYKEQQKALMQLLLTGIVRVEKLN